MWDLLRNSIIRSALYFSALVMQSSQFIFLPSCSCPYPSAVAPTASKSYTPASAYSTGIAYQYPKLQQSNVYATPIERSTFVGPNPSVFRQSPLSPPTVLTVKELSKMEPCSTRDGKRCGYKSEEIASSNNPSVSFYSSSSQLKQSLKNDHRSSRLEDEDDSKSDGDYYAYNGGVMTAKYSNPSSSSITYSFSDTEDPDMEEAANAIYDALFPDDSTNLTSSTTTSAPRSTYYSKSMPYTLFSGRAATAEARNAAGVQKRDGTVRRQPTYNSPIHCNNIKIAAIITEAIIKDNVTESKRQITKLTDASFNGVKFDVICVEGVFSYLVHSKTYCEITKHDITCLVFR